MCINWSDSCFFSSLWIIPLAYLFYSYVWIIITARSRLFFSSFVRFSHYPICAFFIGSHLKRMDSCYLRVYVRAVWICTVFICTMRCIICFWIEFFDQRPNPNYALIHKQRNLIRKRCSVSLILYSTMQKFFFAALIGHYMCMFAGKLFGWKPHSNWAFYYPYFSSILFHFDPAYVGTPGNVQSKLKKNDSNF